MGSGRQVATAAMPSARWVVRLDRCRCGRWDRVRSRSAGIPTRLRMRDQYPESKFHGLIFVSAMICRISAEGRNMILPSSAMINPAEDDRTNVAPSMTES
jgi:hypothetical protein